MENNKKSNRVRINDSLPSDYRGYKKPLRENYSDSSGGNGTRREKPRIRK